MGMSHLGLLPNGVSDVPSLGYSLESATTDQYALAVTAYELLAGHLPFENDDFEVLRATVLQDTPETIRDMSDQVNAALLKALAKDSDGRFGSCTEFIAALGGVEMRVSPKPAFGGRKKAVAPGVEPLMKRGYLALEDSEWSKASGFFDRALDIDAEYAPAYTGLLCAEWKVQSEELLGDYETPIAEQNYFQKALRFADEEYRATVQGYEEKIRERIRQEEHYDGLIKELFGATTEEEYQELAEQFREMNGYKNTAELANECNGKYQTLKEHREEQERIERERTERYDQLCVAKEKASTERAYGIKHCVFRYFNAAGAALDTEIGEWHEPETHLIPLVLDAAAGKREAIQVFGTDYPTEDGTCVRDYIHVCDLAEAHRLGMEHLLQHGTSEHFNLGCARGYSINEVIEAAKKITGRRINVRYADRRAGDPPVLVGAYSKAQNVLQWSPKYSLEDSIESAWKWHEQFNRQTVKPMEKRLKAA